MTEGQLGFGLIGCGEIAVQTARGIGLANNARLVRVMDVNADVARDLAEAHDVPWTTDAAALLADPDVDAVVISVPHYLHAPLTLQAAAAGKHVLCEKPIATSLEDARAMIAACREAGVRLGVPFAAQTSPRHQHLKGLVAAGVIGEVVGTRIEIMSDKPVSYWTGGYTGRVQTDWRRHKEKSGGGILIMNGSHSINTMRFVTGLEAARVYSEYATTATEGTVEDLISVVIRYTNGAIGNIEAGSSIRGRTPGGGVGDRIYGTDGQIILGRTPQIFTTRRGAGLEPDVWQHVPFPPFPEANERQRIVEGFAAAVLAGAQPPCSGEDGLASLAIVLAAYESGESQQAVELG